MMRGDSDLLKQAVLNLVTNAIDAMPAAAGCTFAWKKEATN